MDPQTTITVVIADDHAVTRQGVRALLDSVPDIEVVGEAADGETALALVDRLRPRVLLLDIEMPGLDGFEVEQQVRKRYGTETIVLLLTAHDRDAYLSAAMETGAAGFLLKSGPAQELPGRIREALRGGRLYTPEQWQRAGRWRRAVKARWEALTPREREVMTCVAQGQATEAIAARLGISARTVETHVSRALGKLELRDRVEATAWMWAEGLVDDADRRRPAEGAPAEETT